MLPSKKLFESKTFRSGVIPYTLTENNRIIFLLGVDLQSKQYCDFGGGVKKNETSIDGAIREFNEESQEIFEKDELYKKENYENLLSFMIERKMAITFRPIPRKWLIKARDDFKKRINEKGMSEELIEVVDIAWVDQDEFFKLINNYNDFRLWKRIKNFLKENIWNKDAFISQLKELYIGIYENN